MSKEEKLLIIINYLKILESEDLMTKEQEDFKQYIDNIIDNIIEKSKEFFKEK